MVNEPSILGRPCHLVPRLVLLSLPQLITDANPTVIMGMLKTKISSVSPKIS